LRAEGEIYAKLITDTDGKEKTVFFKRLYNGWYLGLFAQAQGYYADKLKLRHALISTTILLMFVLSYILLRISAQKLQVEEESKQKSSFLARMSHEIRTPLNAILGMVELLLRKEISRDAMECAFSIKQAGNNLLSIINDILDFSKIEAGKMEIINAEYQLASLMNDVISIIRTRILEKPILFVVNIDSALPSVLFGDVARLRQILLNLLNNSVKYTDEGSVAITVEGVVEADTAVLSFEISDTGIGIKQKDIDILFTDFSRLDTHRNIGVESTGLGLAIARSLCRIMGGDITVFSTYGEGSTFTVTLPQKIRDAAPFAVVNEPESKNVLIYEMRMPYANSIVCSVDNLGVKCRLATSYEEFVSALENETFSSIFSASFLFERAFEEVRKKAAGTPVVLLAEFGEVAVKEGVQTISMPVHSISIANI
jgi:signal transduction histidine kinase